MKNNISHTKIWACAIIIPLLTIWIGAALFSVITGSPFHFVEELGPRLIQTLLVALPFIVLSVIGSKQSKSAQNGVNLALTLVIIGTFLFWGYYWFDGISYQLNNRTGGANIGIGLLMLISPLVISALIPVGMYLGKTNK